MKACELKADQSANHHTTHINIPDRGSNRRYRYGSANQIAT